MLLVLIRMAYEPPKLNKVSSKIEASNLFQLVVATMPRLPEGHDGCFGLVTGIFNLPGPNRHHLRANIFQTTRISIRKLNIKSCFGIVQFLCYGQLKQSAMAANSAPPRSPTWSPASSTARSAMRSSARS